MRINYNAAAMRAGNSLNNNNDKVAASLRRLSSGYKINASKDNPAGLALAKRMHAQIAGVGLGSQNSGDGVSILETADGALSEVSAMVQRLSQLCVKASHGVLTDSDRQTIEAEAAQIRSEIERVSQVTEFNSQILLDGSFALKGYTDNLDIKVNYYSETVPVGKYTLTSLTITDELDGDGVPTGNKTVSLPGGAVLGAGFPIDAQAARVENGLLSIKASNGFEVVVDLNKASSAAYGPVVMDLTGKGNMRLQVGANEGQVVSMQIPAVNLRNLSLEKIDLSTRKGAEWATGRVRYALEYLNQVRANLGAYQNRIESTIKTLDATEENMTASYARIMDVDMAKEMTEYTTLQVLTQAGTSMLAQANERPSQILQLLQ